MHTHAHQLLTLCLRQPALLHGLQNLLVQPDPLLAGKLELLALSDGRGRAGLGAVGLLQHPLQTQGEP